MLQEYLEEGGHSNDPKHRAKKSMGNNEEKVEKRSECDNLNPELLSNLCACMKKHLEEVIERRVV
ncbi:17622_t:CDS:2 [Rhizophagus irregularis]|nr:17622_t:CDS:2 [Rhizophagus irregularis]